MSSLFVSILGMSLTASIVAAAVMAVRIPLKSVPKIYSYVLWAVVLFRLLVPATLYSPFAIISDETEALPRRIIYRQEPSDAVSQSIGEKGYIEDSADLDTASTLPASVPANYPAAPPSSGASDSNTAGFSAVETATGIWLTGIVLILAYALYGYIGLLRRLQTAVHLGDNIYESDRINTAFVLGIIRPKIYLPLGLPNEQLEYILAHERTHIRRCDCLIKPLAFLVLTVHWFNPVVWLSYTLMTKDMEMSCDESVLKSSGSALRGIDIRKGYSGSLLMLSARQSGLFVPLAFGESSVRSRVKNVLRYKKPAVWRITLATVLVLTSMAGCVFTRDAVTDQIPDVSVSPDTNSTASAQTFADEVTDNELIRITRIADCNLGLFESPAELSSFQLFNFFTTILDETGGMDRYWSADTQSWHIPSEDITAVLNRYFEAFTFDPEEVFGSESYDAAKDEVVASAYGMQNASTYQSLSVAVLSEDMVAVDAELYDPEGKKLVDSRRITLRVTENGFKYLSCVSKEPLPQEMEPTEPEIDPLVLKYYQYFVDHHSLVDNRVFTVNENTLQDDVIYFAFMNTEPMDGMADNIRTKEQIDDVVMKYFGIKPKRYNTGISSVTASGDVQFGSMMRDVYTINRLLLKELVDNGDGSYDALFKLYQIQAGAAPQDFDRKILEGDAEMAMYYTLDLRTTFTEVAEGESYYLKFSAYTLEPRASAFSPPPQETDYTKKVGVDEIKSYHGLSIGMTLDEAKTLLNLPEGSYTYSEDDFADYTTVNVDGWYYTFRTLPKAESTDETQYLMSINIREYLGVIFRDIKLGDAYEDVIKKFPTAEEEGQTIGAPDSYFTRDYPFASTLRSVDIFTGKVHIAMTFGKYNTLAWADIYSTDY